jgi:hypothetical protein
MQRPNPQRHQVVQYRSRRPRLRPHPNHVVHRQPVSIDTSARAGSISRYRSRQKSPSTATRSLPHTPRSIPRTAPTQVIHLHHRSAVPSAVPAHRSSRPAQPFAQPMQEQHVVALHITHPTAHPAKSSCRTSNSKPDCPAAARPGPNPNCPHPAGPPRRSRAPHNVASRLQPQVVHATQALLEYLRPHDRRSDAQNHPAVQPLDRAREPSEINAAARPTTAPLNIG